MTLDQNAIQKRNFWLKKVFFPLTKDQLFISAIESKSNKDLSIFVDAAKKILDSIINLKFDNIDQEFITLSDIIKVDDIDITATPETLAAYIASLCQEKQIYFDDYTSPKYTVYEIEAFKKTIFGKALVDFECFISQDPALAAPVVQPHAVPKVPSSGGTVSAGKPKLANANGLVDGIKVPLVGNIYWIGGEFINTGKTCPRIHVKPVRQPINGNQLEVFTNGSGQGFEDCVLFWPNSQEANDVLGKVINNKFGSKVSKYELKRQTAKGDFYKVDTEFGPAYIKADRFIEAYNHMVEQDFKLLEKYFD